MRAWTGSARCTTCSAATRISSRRPCPWRRPGHGGQARVTAYRPSPRPTFDGPAAIPYAGVTRHVWGDAESGEVADWIYASTDRVHALVFGLAPGAWFRHSPEFRTIFGADEMLYVLHGTMVLANPETGEVLRVPRGGSAFFRSDTWHHVHAHGNEELRVLELTRRRRARAPRARTRAPGRTSSRRIGATATTPCSAVCRAPAPRGGRCTSPSPCGAARWGCSKASMPAPSISPPACSS